MTLGADTSTTFGADASVVIADASVVIADALVVIADASVALGAFVRVETL